MYKELDTWHNNKIVGKIKLDVEDYDIYKNTKIHITKSGYPYVYVKTKSTFLHRLIMKAKKDEIVDHIFHDKCDARKSQLRIVTRRENLTNQKLSKRNSTGYRGVSLTHNGKNYRASIKVNGKQINCGTYTSILDAAAAAANERKKYGYLDKGLLPDYKNTTGKKIQRSSTKHKYMRSSKNYYSVTIYIKKPIYVGNFSILSDAIKARNNKLIELGSHAPD